MTTLHKDKSIENGKPLDDLPEGWDSALLKTLATLRKGKKPKRLNETFWPGAVPYIDIEAFEKRNIRRYADIESSTLVDKGEILIVWDGARCGHVGKAPKKGALGSTLGAIEPGLIHPDYILRFLQSSYDTINTNPRGIGIPHVEPELFWNLEVPLPPLAEQKRIVVKVDGLLIRVNTTKDRLAKVSVILKRFRQAVLSAACSGRLTADWRSTQKELEPADQLVERIRRKYRQQYEAECNKAKREGERLPRKPEILQLRKVESESLPEIPDEWTWVYLPALGYMNRGKSKHRPRNAPHLYGGPYPFIQTGDIARSRGLITSHQQTYSEAGLAQSHLWPAGTICITIAANIANSAILTYPACFPDSVVGLISDESLCLKEYAEFFIRTARANLDQFAPATAQKNINIEILRDVAVPLPPLTEQKEIVRRVESMFKLADAVEKRVEAAKMRVEKLTQAILAKAFRGELVPTEAAVACREGRSYETAPELLARIKSKREIINVHTSDRSHRVHRKKV
ncbi:MAG: hypothetical protein FJ110_08905 [Deltaproteobacteria bacterium]|nr:hypothetical protein [Deltaproteobacteria bacterium]